MNINQAIEERYSVRRYEESKVEDVILDEIWKYIHSVKPLVSNLKYRLEIVSDALEVKQLKIGFLGGKIKINAPCCIVAIAEEKEYCYENIGFVQEQVVLKLTQLGLGTCWLGTFDQEWIRKKYNVRSNEVVTNVIAFGYPKKSFYNNELRKILRTTKRKEISEVVFYKSWNQSSVEFLNKNPELMNVFRLAVLAPSANNVQPVRIIVDDTMLHIFVLKSNRDIYYKIDGGIFIAHLDLLRNANIEMKIFNEEASAMSIANDVLYIMSMRWSNLY